MMHASRCTQLVTFVVLILLPCGIVDAQDEFATNIRTTDPLTPEEERESFSLPRGFEIQLVASEPDIYKPMNLAFDTKGRLWVSDSTEYPFAVPEGQVGRDSIKILEDEDGDGFAEKVTTFADGLNIPIGLYPYKNGCIVFSIPHIWWLEDTDGDDVADRRVPLYGPMGFERDTHGLNNSFRRGFDGWLYACHGFNNETRVAGGDGHEVVMQSGNTYRMRLDGERIEQFTWGQVNPFGMSLDPFGDLFTADCHSKPIYQLLRGGRYPSFGKPHDGLGFVEPMMDHLHGSTAIAGLSFYADKRFPESFQSNFFSGNVMTSRVNRNTVRMRGATPIAVEQSDFVVSDDPWFRPVDVRMGPDGALYVADFYNRIIGHYEVDLRHEGRDRHRGRVWRIVYTGDNDDELPSLASTSLEGMELPELFAVLGDANLTRRMLAMNLICDLVNDDNQETVRLLAARTIAASDHPEQRAHSYWVLYRAGAPVDKFIEDALGDESPLVRVHGMRILADLGDWTSEFEKLAVQGLVDESPRVRRMAAEALSSHAASSVIESLLEAHSFAVDDPNLEYMIRRGILRQLQEATTIEQISEADLSDSQRALTASVALAVPTPEAAEFILRQLDAADEGSSLDAVTAVKHCARHCSPELLGEVIVKARATFPDNLGLQLELIQSIRDSLNANGQAEPAELLAWSGELSNALIDQVEPYLSQWQNTSVANGTRDDNPWSVERRRSADGNQTKLFFSSLSAGEQATGLLRSKSFVIPSQLSFYCAGHVGNPNQPATAINSVRLVDAESGRLIKEIIPPRNDVAQRIDWDLEDVEGKQGRIEILDGDSRNAYAWIAVGRFEPEVLDVPIAAPRVVAQQHEAAILLCGTNITDENRERFRQWIVAPLIDSKTRRMLAVRYPRSEDDARIRAWANVIDEPQLPESARMRIAKAVVADGNDATQDLLESLFPVLPSSTQLRVLRSFTGSNEGQQAIRQLIEDEKVDGRLLQDVQLNESLRVAGGAELQQLIADYVSDLPAVSEAVELAIERRMDWIRLNPGNLEQGAESFKQKCANCHQLGKEGAEIGPQLDGIGNRGLARVVEDVMDPNRNVDAAFRSSTIITVDGQVYVGLKRREEGNTWIFADREGKEFRVQRGDIDELQESPNSLMPADVALEMKPADFADLVAFLMQQRAKPPESENE